MQNILFGLVTVGPIFLIIAIGVIVRRVGLVDADLAGRLSRLVFYLYLPALILKTMIGTDFIALMSWRIFAATLGTLLVGFFLAWAAAWAAGADRDTRAFFSSGSTWGNVAIIGFALGEALYGEEGLARAAIYAALVLPMHLIIGILALEKRSSETKRDMSGEKAPNAAIVFLRRLVRNPIILAAVGGFALSFLSSGIPSIAMDILDLLGRASLPLALVSIGASLEITKDTRGLAEPLGAVCVKLILMPLTALAFTKLLGMSDEWVGTLVIGFSCPTAIAFFVVSRGLGHDASRGAAIVTATTLGSAFTAGIAAVLLRSFGLA